MGWKEIAAHLKISARTAQEYERERGLPIRRQGDQKKSRIFAYEVELDAWMASKLATRDSTDSASEAVEEQSSSAYELGLEALPPDQPDNINSPTRRQWLKRTAFGVGAGLGLSGLLIALDPIIWKSHTSPTHVRIDGVNVVASGPNGKEIWQHAFPARLDENFYNSRPDACVLADVDADGCVEAILIHSPADRSIGPTLVCLEAGGRLRWEFRPGRTVTDDRGRLFSPPFWMSAFALLPARHSSHMRVVAISNHNWTFPEQVTVLDAASGGLLSEYWHRGHLNHLAVANLGSNEPTVLLGGVNDSPDYKRATLVAFDHRQIAGSSYSRRGIANFYGFPRGSELCRVFFPKTPISEREEFNRVTRIQVAAGRIVVMVAEGIAEVDTPYMVYELDFQFRPLAATPCDTLYARLRAEGYEDVDQFCANLLNGIEVL